MWRAPAVSSASDRRRERGVALIVALMSLTLMLALGAVLVLQTTAETMISANFRLANEGLYAADAAIARTVAEMRGISDWTPVLRGDVRSGLADGPPSGIRTLVDGTTIDLVQLVNRANCGKASCSVSDVAATTADRPWGANNPRWTNFATWAARDLAAAGQPIASSFYVVVLVGDDASETDGDPLSDGASGADPPNPGAGVVMLRAEAFGPRGVHKIVETTLARGTTGGASAADGQLSSLRVKAWREVR